jgi:myo-inositol-1-phosphate synthase
VEKINVAIVGVGNCASALVQGIHYYRRKKDPDAPGLLHWELGGYRPGDIEVTAAFDVDSRKVGKDVTRAVFAPPNCTTVFCPDLYPSGVMVSRGPLLDGYARHMDSYDEKVRCLPVGTEDGETIEQMKETVVRILKASNARVMLNYLPVGSQKATEFYACCALDAGLAFVNSIPVFIASNPDWAARFKEANLPILGDDIMSQIGATVTHRALTELFKNRGVNLERTYQLNTGGNTDFLNMLNRDRLASKKESKTEAVQTVAKKRLAKENIHVGPSDYVAWQKDNKVCFIRMEGTLFGDVPMNLEMRMAVEDSPNSAGVAIDLIRCAALALDRNVSGVLEGPSAFFCKHPPVSFSNETAREKTQEFIWNDSQEKQDPQDQEQDYPG